MSLAVAKAAAADAGVSLFRWLGGDDAVVLPVPMLNVVNGGAHAQNSLDFQEFMLVPAGAPSFAEALQIGAEVYHALKALLHERGLSTGVGDEGGFAPDLGSSEEAIEAVLTAAERAGHRDRVAIALDPAATEFWSDGAYRFEGREKGPEEMVALLVGAHRALSDRVHRGRAGRGRVGHLAGSDRAHRRPRSSSSATTSSSRTSTGCGGASKRASPTRFSSRSTRSAR